MSERIITLFGEEIVPEQLKAVSRSRAKKKSEEKDELVNDEPTAIAADTIIENETISQPDTVKEVEAQATLQEPALPSVEATETPVAATELTIALNDANQADIEIPEIIDESPADDEHTSATNENLVEETEDTADAKAPKKERAVLANLPDDWQGDKKYYSIGEVAEIFKVKTSHIRFWTNEFKLKVRTTRKGDRLYTPEQIREIKTINNLVKERGFTIKGAKTRLKAPEKMEVETVDLKQSLLQLRNKLVAIKNQLK